MFLSNFLPYVSVYRVLICRGQTLFAGRAGDGSLVKCLILYIKLHKTISVLLGTNLSPMPSLVEFLFKTSFRETSGTCLDLEGQTFLLG